jgi:hypothetical protein
MCGCEAKHGCEAKSHERRIDHGCEAGGGFRDARANRESLKLAVGNYVRIEDFSSGEMI